MSDDRPSYRPPWRRSGGWVVAWCLVRSVGSAALITTAYYLVPLTGAGGRTGLLVVVLGPVVFGGLVVWQAVTITRSAYPRLRTVEALATALPLFLVLFAAAYFMLARGRPAAFSEGLSRTDALYFTVTVFATVGFGDIVPVDGTARVLTTVQMVVDLLLIGVVVKVLLGAAKIGVRRRGRPPPGGPGP
jgi:hypothetical protein